MTTTEHPVDVLPRPHRRALLLAAATVWLPCALPLVMGILQGSDHALQHFLMFLPLTPGVIVPVLLGLDDFWFGFAAAIPTIAVFFSLYLAAREMPRRLLYFVQGIVILLIAFEAIGLAHALRA